MIAEPTPQLRPAAQRWGRRLVLDISDVPPTRLNNSTSSTLVPAFVDAKTAESPHSGGVTTQLAPTVVDPALAKYTGSPPSTPRISSTVVPAQPAVGFDDSPHVETAAGQDVLPVLPVLPAPPAPPGVFHTWEPVAATEPSDVSPELSGQDVPSERSSKLASVATLVIIACAMAILVVIVLSAIRLSGLSELGLSGDQLSDRFRYEALVCIPTVAVLSAGLAGAAIFRTKLTN